MSNVLRFVNSGIGQVAPANRMRCWLFVGGRGLRLVGADGSSTKLTLERHDMTGGKELRLAYECDQRRGLTYAEQIARIDALRIVPRVVVEVNDVPTAVQIEFQAAVDPRQLVQVAA